MGYSPSIATDSTIPTLTTWPLGGALVGFMANILANDGCLEATLRFAVATFCLLRRKKRRDYEHEYGMKSWKGWRFSPTPSIPHRLLGELILSEVRRIDKSAVTDPMYINRVLRLAEERSVIVRPRIFGKPSIYMRG